MTHVLIGLTAVAALLPAAVLPLYRAEVVGGRTFWALLAAAVAGPMAFVLAEIGGGWGGGLALNLWVSIAASAVLYFGLCVFIRAASGLAPLMLGYLAVLGLVAVGGQVAAGVPAGSYNLTGVLIVHIILSVVAYALATIAAVAGVAVLLKQRALKRKMSSRLARLLPAVAVADLFQVWLLTMAAGVLGVDILAGMATQYALTGTLLQFEHKTLFAILAFAVISILLLLHAGAGVRGRMAARGVLMGYLLLTLGYPGVKFVSEVLLA